MVNLCGERDVALHQSCWLQSSSCLFARTRMGSCCITLSWIVYGADELYAACRKASMHSQSFVWHPHQVLLPACQASCGCWINSSASDMYKPLRHQPCWLQGQIPIPNPPQTLLMSRPSIIPRAGFRDRYMSSSLLFEIVPLKHPSVWHQICLAGTVVAGPISANQDL